MITRKANWEKDLAEKKLSDFMEMGTKFSVAPTKKIQRLIGSSNPTDMDQVFGDILNTVHGSEEIRSSSNAEYDDQKNTWEKLARQIGFENAGAMAKWLAHYYVEKSGEAEDFDGIEGLATSTNNHELLQWTDYAAGNGDQMVMSFLYGGKRCAQWVKWAKSYMTVHNFIIELQQYTEWNGEDFDVMVMDNEQIQIDINNDRGRKEVKTIFDNADPVFDFEIDEPEESDSWTVTIIRK